MIKVETVTIRRFGKTLYFKVPDIIRDECKPEPGDKVGVYRDPEDHEMFGLKMETKSTVTFLGD